MPRRKKLTPAMVRAKLPPMLPALTKSQKTRLSESASIEFSQSDRQEIERSRAGLRPQFRYLSDTEWSSVWDHVKSVLGQGPLPDEAHIRELVDHSAMLSGYFSSYGEIGVDRQIYSELVKQSRKFLEQTESFTSTAAEFFGDPDDGSSEPFDPWWPERKILGELEKLKVSVNWRLERLEWEARDAEPAPQNTAKPERDKWMARLILVWTEGCKLPSKNSKHLRGFIIDALRPYQTGIVTERMAEQFIERWNSGKITRPSRGPFGMFNL